MKIKAIQTPIPLSVFKETLPCNWVAVVWDDNGGLAIKSGQDNIGESSKLYSEPPEASLYVTYTPESTYVMIENYVCYIADVDERGKVEEILEISTLFGDVQVCIDPKIRKEFEGVSK